ncbi:hypothetical protein P152DRAFT_143548 [Eremomyces bilateralis CBS 781.70]|uniref:MARVEL domain-containing protein n=1 Tax=Eremomyces bilateralis CBS 781.70 TaxID=1392243 RepID=A0A6G1FVR4_9PEZI|nr:uncharacterized protein P152DRAFT_143548 [Eremomyces bilateralis CBS 781.70]KAF1809917.1 hypothetical protein P152DRAFT_143548 [Eremomyces bilateralis CBS 781.70]
MAINPILPLRGIQTVTAIVVLGLTGYVSNWWLGYWHAMAPTQINFLIFCSIWSNVALVYLILAPAKFPAAAHKYAILAVESVTMLFWFAGFVALAVFLGNRVCLGHVCSVAKGATGVAAVSWALFAATTVMAALHCWRTSRHDPNNGPHQRMQEV